MIIRILFIIQEAEGCFNCLLQRTCLLRHSSQALEAWRTRRFDGGSAERLLLSSESDALCLEGIIGALRRAYIKSNLKNKSQTTIGDKEEKHLTIIPPLILAYVKSVHRPTMYVFMLFYRISKIQWYLGSFSSVVLYHMKEAKNLYLMNSALGESIHPSIDGRGYYVITTTPPHVSRASDE